MPDFSVRSRSILYGCTIGAIAFLLSALAVLSLDGGLAAFGHAVIIGSVLGIMSWFVIERANARVTRAVDAVSAHLTEAANGNLGTLAPDGLRKAMPALAETLDMHFEQVRARLDSAHNLAMFDPVTSLANRTNFRDEVDRILAGLPADAAPALMFIDLDHFKNVNDSLGHAVGDQLLRIVGARLSAIVAAGPGRVHGGALIARLAGDEFTVFMPAPHDRKDVEALARMALDALTMPFDIAGNSVQIGASIGIAIRSASVSSLPLLMRAADAAMYHAKHSGRGRVQFYDDAMAERTADRIRLERQLRVALDENQFFLMFQPQVEVTRGAIVAAEALLRWNHPTEGLRLPGSFMPCAESCGLIIDIGDWVAEAIAQTAARWHAAGVEHRIAMNISQREIERPDFFSNLRRAMRAHGTPARLLELEVSESCIMQCGDAVITELAAFRRCGATIAIDDFGTGYSNLGRLKVLPVDVVKLDHGLTADIEVSAQARTIAHALINLLHGLGYRVVAEGVENQGQADVLNAIGCDRIQGYAIASPMHERALMAWGDGGRASAVR